MASKGALEAARAAIYARFLQAELLSGRGEFPLPRAAVATKRPEGRLSAKGRPLDELERLEASDLDLEIAALSQEEFEKDPQKYQRLGALLAREEKRAKPPELPADATLPQKAARSQVEFEAHREELETAERRARIDEQIAALEDKKAGLGG